MKKLYKISDFFTEEDSRFVLSGYAPTDETNTQISVVTKEDFFDAVLFNYGDRYIFIPETETPLNSFYRMWQGFCRRRSSNIAAGMYALGLLYNPIENYNSVEHHRGNDTGLKTPTGWKEEVTQEPTNWKKETTESYEDYKETETLTPDDWKTTETQTPTNWTKESTKNNANNEVNRGTSFYAFNSNNPVPVSSENTTEKLELKEEQKGTFETANEQTGTFETAKEITGSKGITEEQKGTFKTTAEQKGTLEDKTTYNSDITKTGNIGTTTTQQMLGSELELRRVDFVANVLAEFFCSNSIYC